MYTTELATLKTRALRDLTDTLKDLTDGKVVSGDRLTEEATKLAIILDCMDAITAMPVAERPEIIDDLLKSVKSIRANKAWNDFKSKVVCDAQVVGDFAKKHGSNLLSGIGKLAASAANHLNK